MVWLDCRSHYSDPARAEFSIFALKLLNNDQGPEQQQTKALQSRPTSAKGNMRKCVP